MKTTLLLITLSFGLMSGTCESERQTNLNDCNCEVSHYLYVPEVGGAGGHYELQYSEPIEFNCDAQHDVYYPVSNINYNYDKVTCND